MRTKHNIKQRTIKAFNTWSETHKMHENFTWEGKPIKGTAFRKLLKGDAPKAEAKPAELLEDPVNIDIEKEHADLGQPHHSGDTEEH